MGVAYIQVGVPVPGDFDYSPEAWQARRDEVMAAIADVPAVRDIAAGDLVIVTDTQVWSMYTLRSDDDV